MLKKTSSGDMAEIRNIIAKLSHRSIEIRIKALRALCKLPNNLTNQNAIREDGGIASLVDLLEYTDVLVRQKATLALYRLACDNPTNQDAIRKAGGIVPLVALLKDADALVRKNAALALYNLTCDTPINRDAIREAHGIAPLVALLKDTDKAVRLEAVGALSNLARDNRINQNAIRAAGGIVSLVTLLEDADSEVRRWATKALYHLICGNPTNLDAIDAAFPKDGGWASLVDMLEDVDPDASENAAAILCSLVVLEPINQGIRIDNCAMELWIYLADTVDDPLEAYQSFLDSRLYQQKQSDRQLSSNTTSKASMSSTDSEFETHAHSSSRIMSLDYSSEKTKRPQGWLENSAMGKPLKSEILIPSGDMVEIEDNIAKLSHRSTAIRINALRALCDLAKILINQNAIREAGGIVPLVALLEDASTVVRKYAALTLSNLAHRNLTNKDVIRNVGGVVSLIALLKDTDTDTEVIQWVARALCNLACNNLANQDAIREAGGIVLLVPLLAYIDRVVRRYATKAMCNLTYGNPTNQDAIRKIGGIVLLVALLKDPGPDVRKCAAGGLCNLADQPINQAIMIDNGAMELLSALASTEEYAQMTLNACQIFLDSSRHKQKQSRGSLTAEKEVVINVSLIPSSELSICRDRLLGSGGFGKVYFGIYNTKEVAVKVLSAQGLSEQALLSLRKEASIHGALRDPNIVKLWGICTEPGQYSMVMEYMAGGSLHHVLHSNRELSWAVKLSVACNIADGLYYLHENGVIHRDLKSLNVLLDEDCKRAKLCDFGLAKVKTESSCSSSTTVLGTTRWQAPELLESSGTCTTKSDIYALGWILWELLTHKSPFEDVSHAKEALIMKWISEGERAEVPRDAPPRYAELIRFCWEPKPTRRPENVKWIAEELEQIEAPHDRRYFSK